MLLDMIFRTLLTEAIREMLGHYKKQRVLTQMKNQAHKNNTKDRKRHAAKRLQQEDSHESSITYLKDWKRDS